MSCPFIHSDSGICHLYAEVYAILCLISIHPDIYTAPLGEFDCVLHKMSEYLVKFLDISVHHGRYVRCQVNYKFKILLIIKQSETCYNIIDKRC